MISLKKALPGFVIVPDGTRPTYNGRYPQRNKRTTLHVQPLLRRMDPGPPSIRRDMSRRDAKSEMARLGAGKSLFKHPEE